MKLSIITVNLNGAVSLRRTIESVLSQTYTDFEYLIIDGGSIDESLDVIKEYSDKIAYWVSKPDNGIYNAMNKGISKAKGEYCLFLNSGDFFYSDDTLEKAFQLSDGSDIIYGDVFVTQKQPEKTWVQEHPSDLSLMSFLTGGICHQAAFLRRKLFEQYGLYNESYKIVSDWEFFINTIIFSDVKYKHINLIVSVYNREGFANQNPQEGIYEMQKVLEDKFPRLVIEDLERFKNNYSNVLFLTNLKRHNFWHFVFKVFKKTARFFIK